MLKKWYETPTEAYEKQKIVYKRSSQLWNELMELFPPDIDAFLSIDDLGETFIRAFIRMNKDDTEENNRLVRKIISAKYGQLERNFREGEGTFFYMSKDQDRGDYKIRIFIENSHPGQCKIKKVTKTVEVYETDCKEETK